MQYKCLCSRSNFNEIANSRGFFFKFLVGLFSLCKYSFFKMMMNKINVFAEQLEEGTTVLHCGIHGPES